MLPICRRSIIFHGEYANYKLLTKIRSKESKPVMYRNVHTLEKMGM